MQELTIKSPTYLSLFSFDVKDVQKEDYKELCSSISKYGIKSLGESIVVYIDETPILAAGLVESRKGVYDSWIIFSNAFNKSHVRKVVRLFKNYFSLLGYDRIEHIIREEMLHMVQFIKMCGFSFDAKLKKGYDGKDCYLYSIVKE